MIHDIEPKDGQPMQHTGDLDDLPPFQPFKILQQLVDHERRIHDLEKELTGDDRACRECGCTEDNACVDDDGNPCSWVEWDLCSSCAAGHPQRPRIVCLCGSGRFREAFEQAELDETLAGKIVLTIGCNTKDVARDVDWSHVKPMLDQLHLRKIDLADEVLVLNVDGYIGASTARELDYAQSLGKPVRFWESDGDR